MYSTEEITEKHDFRGEQSLAALSAPVDLADGADLHGLANHLEPYSLVEAFLRHPPVDFQVVELPLAKAANFQAPAKHYTLPSPADGVCVPAFLAKYDLMTTVDDLPQWWTNLTKRVRLLGEILKPMTLFVGTTVSEYCLVPASSVNIVSLFDHLRSAMHVQKAEFVIFKDIPHHSPLLRQHENSAAQRLLEQCRDNGWLIVAGQALAYVKIDFASEEEYLSRLSSKRRKDLKRKLRSARDLTIKEVRTGSPIFKDQAFLDQFFSMYINVFDQSEVHFDKLTRPFFERVLQTAENHGVVFLYYRGDKFIGWNLCFVHNNSLVDKYIGFVYPDAREANLYFVSWFHNLRYAVKHGLDHYIAGWTDPEVKSNLGAQFTFTKHAVFIRNRFVRACLKPFVHLFESDLHWSMHEAEANSRGNSK